MSHSTCLIALIETRTVLYCVVLLQARAQAGSSQKGGHRQSALKGTPPPSKKRKESEQQGDGDGEVRCQGFLR